MKAILNPNMKSLDLTSNDNLLTSALYKILKVVEYITINDKKITEVKLYDKTKDNDFDVDIIITLYCKEDVMDIFKSYKKPIFVFNWDCLNGGFFLDNYIDKNGLIYGSENESIGFFNIELINKADWYYEESTDKNDDIRYKE